MSDSTSQGAGVIARLRRPGGAIGVCSLAAALILGLTGASACVALAISLATGGEFWSDDASDKVWAILFFAVIFLGAVGFFVMDRAPALGATLGVLGGLALAFLLFWAIVPLFVGLLIAALAVWRMRLLTHPPAAVTP